MVKFLNTTRHELMVTGITYVSLRVDQYSVGLMRRRAFDEHLSRL